MNERGHIMRVDVSLAPGEITAGDAAQAVVVVIDVLRATSTIVVALANGCEEIIATESIEEAINIASGYTRADYVLGGERRGLAVDGFDLGNSPAEYEPARVSGKKLIFTTTNGTRAIKAYGNAYAIYAASFLNADAVFRELAHDHSDRDIVLACAGQDSRFCLEDALCAGLLAARLRDQMGASLSDSANAAADLFSMYESSIHGALASSNHGSYLIGLGYGQDVEFCSRRSEIDIVPKVYDRRVIRRAPAEQEE